MLYTIWFFIAQSFVIIHAVNTIASLSDQPAVDESAAPQNYQGTVFLYPTGVRSERDIPVCSKWVKQNQELEKEGAEVHRFPELPRDLPGYFNGTTKQGIIRDFNDDDDIAWESACNIIHKRYFYPPVVERLCRCPERTECPWEWSQPPSYTHNLTKPSKPRGHRDPFTIMLSSRSQAKFCTEVTSALPRCPANKGKKPKQMTADGESSTVHSNRDEVNPKLGEIANLVKTLRMAKAGGVEEVPRVTVNCFCPPLYRQWRYIGQTEPTGFENGTIETSFHYKCEKLPRCRTNERCGNIRTDLHFSFYHCTCPRNNLCLPKVYPPEGPGDVEEDVNEVLFKGQIAPGYCTPFP